MARSISDIEKVVKELAKKKAVVGWFSGNKYQDGTTVASVALKNEFGERNVPARPFIRPTITNKRDQWAKELATLVRNGLNATEVMEGIGLAMVGDIQRTISRVHEPPLAELTLEKRRERGNNSIKPLVDTRIMFTTITNAVEDK